MGRLERGRDASEWIFFFYLLGLLGLVFQHIVGSRNLIGWHNFFCRLLLLYRVGGGFILHWCFVEKIV